MKTPPKSPLAKYSKPDPAADLSAEQKKDLTALVETLVRNIRDATKGALLVGLRILAVQSEGGSLRESIGGFLKNLGVTERTCYRWCNAAGAVLAKDQGAEDADEVVIPAWEPKSKAWAAAEKLMADAAAKSSLRRLILGGAGNQADADMTRIDHLIDMAESGDPHADEILRKMDEGLLSPVQAIRAAAGAAATRGKTRKDPVYLDIDSETGRPRGLFFKSLITIQNTFSSWNSLDEAARPAARAAWKALVASMPPDLR